jgi:hypothetical protein
MIDEHCPVVIAPASVVIAAFVFDPQALPVFVDICLAILVVFVVLVVVVVVVVEIVVVVVVGLLC